MNAAERIRQLEQQLVAAQATIEALQAGQEGAAAGPGAAPGTLQDTQEALLQSEEKLRAIFDTALEAIVITDDEGVFLQANAAAAELFGASREEIVGSNVRDFAAPQVDFDSSWEHFLHSRTEQGLIALRRPDGAVRVAEYSAVAAFVPGQNLSVMRDVTQRLEMEMEREDTLARLNERVKELTLLHKVGRLLDRRGMNVGDMLQAIVELIPAAWQHSDVAVASITYGDLQVQTPGYQETPWVQRATFAAPGGSDGVIEVRYLEERPAADEGPFLAEERTVLDALTSMLQADLERRQATQSLQHSEERYRELFETMAQGIIYQDREGRVIDINAAGRRILGLEQVEISTAEITNNDMNLVREDGSPFPPQERPGRRALRTGEAVYGEVMGMYNPAEQSYRWVSVNSIPQFRPGEPEPYQVYSTLEDITERKHAEEHRAQLAALVDSSQDAIIGVDFDGNITSWNRGAQQIFGYKPEEVRGRSMRILSPPEYRDEQLEVVDRVRRGETVENYSTVRLTKGGKRLFINFSISPILDTTGKPVGVAAIARDVTGEKRTEARLRLQAQLLDSVNESVVACDLNERVVYWGKGAAELYGYTRAEALGRTLRELNLLTEDLAEAERRAQIEELQETGSWSGEVRQQRKDGSRFWARISLSIVRDRNGKAVGFIGIDRDVTSARQHERELTAIAAVADILRTMEGPEAISEAIFRELKSHLDAEGCAVAILDPDGKHYRLAYVVGYYEEWKGAVVALDVEITGEVIRKGQRFYSDDVGAALGEVGSDMSETWSAACVPLIASNRTVGALWVARQETFSEAELRLISSVADILASAVQRAQFFEKLEEQAFQVQRIMDTVEDGLLLLDSERRVLLANPSAEEYLMVLGLGDGGDEQGGELLGRQVVALGGRRLNSILHSPPATEQVIASGGAPRREFDVAAHPVVENGQDSGWVLVLRDVTEIRRTQEMVQQQERLAAVGQLAAGIAHDFNNVMSAIVLYAQILQRRDDLSDKERRRLDVIYRQANHAIELIKQILDFSRRSVMERSAMDLVPFFKEMFRLFDHTLPESINLSLQYDEAEYFVMADPTRLQQAITNLAINARDAMPEGGSLTVHLSRKELAVTEVPPAPDMKPGVWLQIAVIDSGEGMSAEMLQHAFEPFYTTKRPGKGTGLGLAQVYGIIRQHDGFITVDSVSGQGATFTIYLPLLAEERSHLEVPVPMFAEAATAVRDATILVVEDEEWARIAVEDTLQALGYQVLTAHDGQAALEMFASHGDEIDLVLSDMVMPEMGGMKLFEHIRAHHPHVKMVIMSGYPLERDGRSLLEQGIVAWISKPFSVNDLAQKVAEALK